MKQEDKLRHSLRDYYDTQQVPFNETDWEKASAQLRSARRGRKRRLALFFFIPLLSLVSTALYLFPLSVNNKEPLVSFYKHKTPNPGFTSQPETHPGPGLKKNSATNPNSEIRSTRAQENVNPLQPPKNTPEEKTRVGVSNPSGNSKELTLTGVVITKPATKFSDPDPIHNGTKYDLTLSATGTGKNNEAKVRVKDEPAALKENPELATPEREHQAENQTLLQPKETFVLPANAEPQTSGAFTLNDHKNETDSADPVPPILPGKENSMSTPDTSYSLLADHTIILTREQEIPGSPVVNYFAGEGFFYEAGANWLYGWKGSGKRDARGLSPLAGINYMSRLSPRSAFSFGLQYLLVRNLSNSSKTSRVSSYTYGEQSKVTVVTPIAVHYLMAPLRFYYYSDRHNSFGAGLNLAYLLNVDATVTNYEERPGFTGTHQKMKLSGYTEGFSWFDSQLAFCYMRKFGNAFGLRAGIFIGLKDVKEDGFFGFKNKERNSGANLSLVYYVSRKNNK